LLKPPRTTASKASVAVALAACATTAALAAVPAQAAANAGFNTSLARLASLTNYRFTNVASNDGYKLAISGLVHGPRDWQTNVTAPLKESTYDVNGHGYSLALGHVIPVAFRTPAGLTHLDGEYSAAQGLVGYTHVTGMRISNRGSCKVAGVAGTRYFLRSPRADTKLLVETVSACISKRSGALLSYDVGVPSGSELKTLGAHGMSTSFRVTAVGHVGVIRVPRAHATAAAA
jgi:hypothetical protein